MLGVAGRYPRGPRPGTATHQRVTSTTTADVPEACFWGRQQHELTPLIETVQELITAIRQVNPS